MADDANALAGMSRGDLAQARDDARVEVVVRLTLLPAPAALVPVASSLGKALFDLRPRKALPLADVDLAQRRVRQDRDAEARADDLRRLAGAGEVARVDRVDSLAGELVRERARLLAPELVQRLVRMPLEAALAVPIRLSMPHE